jgi:hypothetical protein
MIVDCVATCEIDLSAAWDACRVEDGAAADFVRRPFALAAAPERGAAYAGGVAGEVVLTLAAGRALAALRDAWERGGVGGDGSIGGSEGGL